MKDLIITNDWIDRYNDGELTEPEKGYFRQQMANNPLLRAEVYIDAQLNHFLRDEDLLELRQKVQAVARKHNQKIRWMNYLAIAASVVCLIVLGGILYHVGNKSVSPPDHQGEHTSLPLNKPQQAQLSRNGSEEKTQIQQTNPLPPAEISPTPLLAENYKPMAEFELMVGSVTRSTQLRLVEPLTNISVKAGTPVLFRWIAQNNASGVTMVLLNNRGDAVFETPLIQTGNYSLQTKGLPFGLYYWKIMYLDELVIMGKIILN